LLDCGVDLTDHTYPYVQILHFKFPADIDEVTVQANSESTRCAIVSVQNNTVRYILAMFLCVILKSCDVPSYQYRATEYNSDNMLSCVLELL